VIATAALLTLPAGAWAATVTTDKACYKAGEPGTVKVDGFNAGSTVDALVDGQPMVNLLPDGSGSATAPFTPLASPDTGEASETLIATDSNVSPVLTAQTTYKVTATAVKMSPASAKLTAIVKWRLSGFGAGTAYLHVARRNAAGKTVTVRTITLGTLTGACGALTVSTRQLPVAKPSPGTTYLLRFNTRSAPTAAALVSRTVRTPAAARAKTKTKSQTPYAPIGVG
jgi:hypothetical protein